MAHFTSVRALLVLCALPVSGGTPAKESMTVRELGAGIKVLVSPLSHKVTTGGIESKGTVEAYGGTGSLLVRTGLTQDIDLKLTEVNVEELVKVFPDVPAPVAKLAKGRIGLVTVTVRGDVATLKATKFRIPKDPVSRVEATLNTKTNEYKAKIYAFGGLIEVEGKIDAKIK
jgi:hypothetical protein